MTERELRGRVERLFACVAAEIRLPNRDVATAHMQFDQVRISADAGYALLELVDRVGYPVLRRVHAAQTVVRLAIFGRVAQDREKRALRRRQVRLPVIQVAQIPRRFDFARMRGDVERQRRVGEPFGEGDHPPGLVAAEGGRAARSEDRGEDAVDRLRIGVENAVAVGDEPADLGFL